MFIITCASAGCYIFSYPYYGLDAERHLQSTYAIQAKESLGEKLKGSYNTFLSQGCRLLVANPTANDVVSTISMKRYDGTNVELARLINTKAHGLTDYNLCGVDKENVYGVVTIVPQNKNTIFANVVRIGENEQYKFSSEVSQ